jgi:hypothetical protein
LTRFINSAIFINAPNAHFPWAFHFQCTARNWMSISLLIQKLLIWNLSNIIKAREPKDHRSWVCARLWGLRLQFWSARPEVWLLWIEVIEADPSSPPCNRDQTVTQSATSWRYAPDYRVIRKFTVFEAERRCRVLCRRWELMA